MVEIRTVIYFFLVVFQGCGLVSTVCWAAASEPRGILLASGVTDLKEVPLKSSSNFIEIFGSIIDYQAEENKVVTGHFKEKANALILILLEIRFRNYLCY